MIFPKNGHLYSDAYLEWIRTLGCFFCQRTAPSEPHHHPARGMGNALTDDLKVVPVCRECHRRCEGIRVAVASGVKMPILKSEVTAAVNATFARFWREAPRETVSAVVTALYEWRQKRGL